MICGDTKLTSRDCDVSQTLKLSTFSNVQTLKLSTCLASSPVPATGHADLASELAHADIGPCVRDDFSYLGVRVLVTPFHTATILTTTSFS